MHCSHIADLIEPIAAGDLQPDDEVRAHLQSCPSCAGALASAHRLEEQLRSLECPPAPPAFAAAVLQRIRRDKWRAEQNVDRLFNGAIVLALVLIAVGVVALLNVNAVLTFSGSVWTFLRESSRETVRTTAPTVATYVAAIGLLASALGMWWWAERRLHY